MPPGRLNPSNRRVRTRMHGGVGGVEPQGSPLSRFVLFPRFIHFPQAPGAGLFRIPQAPGARSARLATRHAARHAVACSGPAVRPPSLSTSSVAGRGAVALSGPDLFISLRRRALAPRKTLNRVLNLHNISCFRQFASHVSSLIADRMAAPASSASAVITTFLIEVHATVVFCASPRRRSASNASRRTQS